MKIQLIIQKVNTEFNNARDRHTRATQPVVDFLARRPTLPPPAYAYVTVSGSKTRNTEKSLKALQFYQATADNTGGGQSSFDPIRRQQIIDHAVGEMKGSIISSPGRGKLAYDLMLESGANHEQADEVARYVMDASTMQMLGLAGLGLVPTNRELNIIEPPVVLVRRRQIINQALTGEIPQEFLNLYESEIVQRGAWASEMFMNESAEVSYEQGEIFADEVMAIFNELRQAQSDNNDMTDTVIEENARYFQQDYGFSLSVARKVAEAALYADEQTYNVILRINEDETLTPQQKLEALRNRGIINDEDIDPPTERGSPVPSDPITPTNPGDGITEEPVITNSDPAQEQSHRTAEIVTDTDPDSTVSKSTSSNPVDYWEALRNGVVKRRTTTQNMQVPPWEAEVQEEPKREPTVEVTDPKKVVAASQEQEETNPASEKQGQRTRQKSTDIQSIGF